MPHTLAGNIMGCENFVGINIGNRQYIGMFLQLKSEVKTEKSPNSSSGRTLFFLWYNLIKTFLTIPLSNHLTSKSSLAYSIKFGRLYGQV